MFLLISDNVVVCAFSVGMISIVVRTANIGCAFSTTHARTHTRTRTHSIYYVYTCTYEPPLLLHPTPSPPPSHTQGSEDGGEALSCGWSVKEGAQHYINVRQTRFCFLNLRAPLGYQRLFPLSIHELKDPDNKEGRSTFLFFVLDFHERTPTHGCWLVSYCKERKTW